MKRKNAYALAGFLLACVFALIFIMEKERKSNQDAIKVSGNIEATQVELSFKIPGRLESRLVDEGQSVRKGETVALLDKQDIEPEVLARKAELELAAAKLEELEAGYLPEEISKAKAIVERTSAELQQAESDFIRQKQLYNEKVISDKEYETSKSSYEVGRARYAEAKEHLALLERGIRPEKIQQAKAQLDQAKENYKLAKIKLSYAALHSPLDGVVLSKNAEPGEYVQAGVPIITVADLANTWLRAYISETDLGQVKVGQRVEIQTDNPSKKIYSGFISFISSEAEFTPKNVQTEKERVKLVYRIKIQVANPELELKVGMPADAYIQLKK